VWQIYNVDKRIQEDNLQHLALFSEYGRMALAPQEKEAQQQEKDKQQQVSVHRTEQEETCSNCTYYREVCEIKRGCCLCVLVCG
jgi:hypothetical protein